MNPVFDITLDGQSIPLSDRLLSLEISDKAGVSSDQLTLSIADPDGALTLPRRGVKLASSIGYAETGLVNKGVYVVDEIDYSSPPNRLDIVARAANFRRDFREKRETSYHKRTLNDIVSIIASRAGLTPVIDTSYANIIIPHIDQTISDSAFMAMLAEQYGALGTVKNGRLLFIPEGQGKTISGVQIPPVTIARSQCENWRLSIADRTSNVTGITTRYLDRDQSQTFTVTVGSPENTITLRMSYPTKSEATAAAQAELKRRKRKGKIIELTLAQGNPSLIAETPITLTGFKPDIDGSGWLVNEVRHTLGSGGFNSALALEVKA